jgi:type I restriction-modification system DNA methylase subunit
MTLCLKLLRQLEAYGFARTEDSLLLAAVLPVAIQRCEERTWAEEALKRLGNKLQPKSQHDGQAPLKEWLAELTFSELQADVLDMFIDDHFETLKGDLDWTSELDALLEGSRSGLGGLSMGAAMGRALGHLIAPEQNESCACGYPGAAMIAWSLSADRNVSLFAGDPQTSMLMSVFALASGRKLEVDRRNPVDGSYMPAGSPISGDIPELRNFDVLITAPPLGLRLPPSGNKPKSLEAFQIETLAHQPKQRFVTIVGDGILFRDGRAEASIRRQLIQRHPLRVVSLPAGVYGRSSGVVTSLLEAGSRVPSSGKVTFFDARTKAPSGGGRAQEELTAKFIGSIGTLKSEFDCPKSSVSIAELEVANFSLIASRYIKSERLAAIESAMASRPTVALGSLADIERAKAPQPIREDFESAVVECFEIAPSDIVDGYVRSPKRQLSFDEKEASRLDKVSVRKDDILVSIKGNVGIVGLVGEAADTANDEGHPWIVSQSLAIIRLRSLDTVSPAVLNAILTAPWVRESLERLSGSTTVKTLPIDTLRKVGIPVPAKEQQGRIDSALADLDDLKNKFEDISKAHEAHRAELWLRLWGTPANIGSDLSHA